MAQFYEDKSHLLMALSQSIPVPIWNIRALLYVSYLLYETESLSQTHFELVVANLYLHTHVVCIDKFKMFWIRKDVDLDYYNGAEIQLKNW